MYRESFSRVDVFNKLALGPHSVHKAYSTKLWTFKVFLGFLSMAETNAYLAYKWRHRDNPDSIKPHLAWREDLAYLLIKNNQFIRQRSMRPKVQPRAAVPDRAGLHHTRSVRNPTRSNPMCGVCRRARTPYRCTDCEIATCAWSTGRDCQLQHMLAMIDGQAWLEARVAVGENDDYHETDVF